MELAARIGQSLLKKNKTLTERNELLEEQVEHIREEVRTAGQGVVREVGGSTGRVCLYLYLENLDLTCRPSMLGLYSEQVQEQLPFLHQYHCVRAGAV